jgi:hypothetical protein
MQGLEFLKSRWPASETLNTIPDRFIDQIALAECAKTHLQWEKVS